MESTNFHHQHQHRSHQHHGHQLQDDQLDTSSSSSSLVAPSWYLASSNNLHAWTTLNNQSLNTTNYFNNEHLNEESLCNNNNNNNKFNTRDSRRENDLFVPPSVDLSSSSSNNSTTTTTSSMIQDLGFQYWTNNNHQSDNCYPKFTEMLCSSAPTEDQFLHHYDHNSTSFGGILGNNNNNIPSRGNFSPIIFPSINISNLNSTAASRASSENISNSLDMNLQALDLLTSARFNRTFSDPSVHSLALLEENPCFAPQNLHQSIRRSPPSIGNSYKVSPSSFINGVTAEAATKRPNNNNTVMEPKTSDQAPAKKSRVDQTRACPPFKVRKEKLGDRIANLQQLVAPFGKTDTASVLMEAIGYINFLQNQVETLSVPYMKSSSRNKTHRSSVQYQQSTHQVDQGDGNNTEETKRDLRSRGLCLVPLSCLSYVANDGGGGGIWPHTDYHGCTALEPR